MKVEIERQRRKTIVLKILNSQTALLKVPMGLSKDKIDEFLTSKQDWIEKTVAKLQKNQTFANGFDLQDKLYLDGVLVGSVSDLKSRSKNRIKNFYQAKFSVLKERAIFISKAIGLKVAEVKIYSSVRVWGSFSTEKVMKLNWKLVILPQILVDYVIIHELCHGKHMNHSPNFWKTVEKYCHDYKIRKKELSKFSFVLKQQF